MTDKYKNNYLRLIKQYISGNNQCFPKHKVFEILSAIDLDMILWDDLPPDFDTKFNVPHKMDYGVDLITLEYDKCCQVKLYNENSRITWTDFSTFYTYSKGILNIDNMVLYTTPVAKIDKMCIQSIQNDSNIEVIRQDFDNLIDKYSTDINRIECLTSSESSLVEERHYLLECYKIFNDSTESQLYFQLPCGTGKSYIMLYILSKYIQEHPESKHIIFCPWIDLAKQTYELFVTNNIKTDFIGDGKHSITEASNVIVCINMSVSHIPSDIEITYKIIDEAHHLESEDSQIRKQINKLQCIKELNLSATFHNQECLDFNYPMNEAIEDGYISDYQMVIGYFESGDKIDELVSLIKNHTEWSPMFVYFNTTEKCKVFNDKLKQVNIKSTYITGDTPSIEREQTKTDIESDKLQVVCLCGVYNEGVSIDCLQTVVFGDLRHSQINKIQIAMRANRKHSCKPFYRVVLPVVESDFSEKDIQELIRTFAEIDTRLVEDIRNKNQLRVKLIMNDGSNEANLENAELLYEQVYDRMGVMIEGMSAEEIWFMKFEMLKEFIDDNLKLPSQTSKNRKICNLGQWRSCQRHKYTNKIMIMNDNIKVYNTWTDFINDPKYINYFKTDEEKWYYNFNMLKDYIEINNLFPTKNDNKTLNYWIGTQKTNYKKQTDRMKNKDIYDCWTDFINDPKYIDYFKTPEEQWQESFNKLKTYIDTYDKRPTGNSLDKDIKFLGCWILTQKTNYKKKKGIMEITCIYNIWTEFINDPKYIDYLKNDIEIWSDRLIELKQFLDDNLKFPNRDSKIDYDVKLNTWLNNQRNNYKYKIHHMSNSNGVIYLAWKNFINDIQYINYFKTNEEIWYDKFNELKQYIDKNKNTPSHANKDPIIRVLGQWFDSYKHKYKNKLNIMNTNIKVYNTWTDFINDPQYINYFKTDEEKWYDNLIQLKEFVSNNNRFPTVSKKDEKTLYSWISTQKQKYKNENAIMTNKEIYNCWAEFINDPKYSEYLKTPVIFINDHKYSDCFKTSEEKWYNKFNELKDYLNKYKKRPSSKNKETEQLGIWIGKEIRNYKNNKGAVSNDEAIKKDYELFMNNSVYNIYFKTDEEKWYDNFNMLKDYIEINNCFPAKNDNKTLNYWIGTQNHNYKKQTDRMKNKDIYDCWTDFINDPKYIDYFQTDIDKWFNKFNRLKTFIITYKKSPSSIGSNFEEPLLGQWLSTQRQNYKNNECIMKNSEIYTYWTEFINDTKYKQNPEHVTRPKSDYTNLNWVSVLSKLKEFINKNNKLPNSDIDRISKNGKRIKKELTDSDDINEKFLGCWLIHQKQNYLTNEQIMSKLDIYNVWSEFINDPIYTNYFKSKIEIWNDNFEKVIQFTDDNHKLPVQNSKNIDEKHLGCWLSHQRRNYNTKNKNMSNPDIYEKWSEFINDLKYIDYFKTNEEKWYDHFDKLKHFITINNKKPRKCDDDIERSLFYWYHDQNKNYKKQTAIMKDPNIYNTWTQFITDYIQYL